MANEINVQANIPEDIEVQVQVDVQDSVSAKEAEAWARGSRAGVPVGSSDPTYHNNAMWYAEQAQGSATSASGSASDASASKTAAAGSASAAANSESAAAGSASAAEASKNAAAQSASDASASKTAAAGSASDASASKTAAAQSATSAASSASTATGAKNDAVTAKNDAVTAKNAAVAAKEDAIDAKNDAVTAKNDAVTAKNDAVSAKNDAVSAKDLAEAAVGHYPKVMNGTWWVWNSAAGVWQDTEVKATGEWRIVKTYASIAAMNADYSGTDVQIGEFVMVVSNVEDPDNAKLYVKGSSAYQFIVDMSGATGIKGDTGAVPDIIVGDVTTGAPGSPVTITRRAGSPNTAPIFDFSVPQGEKGEKGSRGRQGEKGEPGVAGQDGEAGPCPAISIGTVTTGAAGTQASVERRAGSPDEAPVFDFTIPQGAQGNPGLVSDIGNGIYTLHIDNNGDLIATYADGGTPPALAIDANGDLILTY